MIAVLIEGAFPSTLGNEPLAVRVGGHVGAVYGEVVAHAGVRVRERADDAGDAVAQERVELAQLCREAVAGIHGRDASERGLQARVFRDKASRTFR